MEPNSHPLSSDPPREILLAKGLQKSYGPRLALQGLTFSLNAGRILGFLGPNGAGKTTSIRILTTMLEPDAGEFSVDGISSRYPQTIRRRIGVLPENMGFPKHMTGIEYLTYFGQLYGRPPAEARSYARMLLEEVGLQQRARSLIGTYSHGMRQRIGIARSLVNNPVVVFLDEPTLGLDPRGQQELLGLILRIAHERNAGVILCSHLLSEIEGVCDDVVILNSGQVVAQGPVKQVIGQTQQNSLRVRVPPPAVEGAVKILASLPGVLRAAPTGQLGGWLGVELSSPDGSPAEDFRARNRVLQALIQGDIPILGFEIEGGRLQDVFLQLTEEAIK